MPYLAQVQLIGHLGRDAETKFSASGVAFTKFSVAVGRKGKDGSKETDWYAVTGFKLPDWKADSLTKGALVYVGGRLQIRQYEGRDGKAGTSVEVVAADIEVLTPKGEGAPQTSAPGPVTDDDIPF